MLHARACEVRAWLHRAQVVTLVDVYRYVVKLWAKLLSALMCLQLLGPRRRTVVDYREKSMLRKIGSDSDSDFDDGEGPGSKRQRKDDADGTDVAADDEGDGSRKKSKKVNAIFTMSTLDV